MQKNRRDFLTTASTAVAAFTIVPRHVLGGPRFVAPSDRVNVALIGAGGQGRTNLRELLKLDDVRVMAVADPIAELDLDKYYYKGKAGREVVAQEIEKHYRQKQSGFQCQRFVDFREMLVQHPEIDAVLCATPDHLHAYVSVTCMRQGKHLYCEKPLTHSVWEARQVARVAKETGVATQMGNQGHATEGMRQTVEWIRAGCIGQVREAHAWSGASRWNLALTTEPRLEQATPDGVHWDLWIGPRQPRPYSSVYCPVSWRDFWDFGTGPLGDIGCHDMDAAVWALDLHSPTAIEGHPAGKMDETIAPHGEVVYYDFPARGTLPPVRLTWYDGGLKPAVPEVMGKMPLGGRGVMFVGDRGVMVCGGAGGPAKLYPESLDREFKRPEPTIRRVPGHHRDWIDAVKGGEAPSSNFEYGARLTEIVLLGVIAVRSNKKLNWNAAEMTFEDDQANRLLKGSYRAGWELPTMG